MYDLSNFIFFNVHIISMLMFRLCRQFGNTWTSTRPPILSHLICNFNSVGRRGPAVPISLLAPRRHPGSMFSFSTPLWFRSLITTGVSLFLRPKSLSHDQPHVDSIEDF